MRIKPDFVLRCVAGYYFVIPAGERVVDFNGIITLNSVAAFLWEKLQKNVTIDELTDMVVAEYEVDYEVAKKDVIEFIDCLWEGMILDGCFDR